MRVLKVRTASETGNQKNEVWTILARIDRLGLALRLALVNVRISIQRPRFDGFVGKD